MDDVIQRFNKQFMNVTMRSDYYEDIKQFIQSEIRNAKEEEREIIKEKIKKLYKHYGHKDHNDKDEWYACLKCMDDANLDKVIDSLK